MTAAAQLLQRLIQTPRDLAANDDAKDRWRVRNATCLIGAISSVMGVVVFGLVGTAELYVPSALVGLGFLAAFELSRRGRRRLACITAVIPLQMALLYNTHNFGPGLFESAYLMCVCVAYLLLEADDADVLLGVIVITTAMTCIGCFAWDEPLFALEPGERNQLLCATVCLTLSNIATVLFYFLGTRRRAALRLRTALREANAANRAKSHFLASMSHEIRTPMNGVIGMLSVLEQTRLTDSQRDYLDTAQLSSRALIDIINDILDLSKVEAGELTIERNPFDLRALVETSSRLAAVQAADDRVQVICRYLPEVPAGVLGDSGRVRQVLCNLLTNALKFTERGHVLVAVECIERDADRATLELSVTDTGVGIPEAEQERIFEKFKQVDGETRLGRGGTGLGLAIVRQLTRLMGGSVGVTSTPGHGARFFCRQSFDLDPDAPALAGSQVVEPAAPAPANESSDANLDEPLPLRALVVDPHDLRSQTLCDWLNYWRVSSRRCRDTDEAQALLSGGASADSEPFHFDLVFLAATGEDGAKLVAEWAARESQARVVQMRQSASSRPGSLAPLTPTGRDVLTLPLRHLELAHLLGQVTRVARVGTGPVATARAKSSTWPTGLRVLVVDDNPINQKVARRLLQNLHCQVDVASSGREALDSLKYAAYELVFMDVQMPDMDGLETTTQIRAAGGDPPGGEPDRSDSLTTGGATARDVPIVAMTAHAMGESREQCLAVGMDGFVSKPVEQQDLAALLDRFAGRLTRDRQTSSRE